MRTTFKPHNKRVKRSQGFRAKMKSSSGRDVINRRRAKGRVKIST